MFGFKKKKNKEEKTEEQKEDLIKRLILGYKEIGYTKEQIKKLFVDKGYPAEFIDYMLIQVKGGQKHMVKKQEYEEEEELDEEEELEEEEEEPAPRPLKKEKRQEVAPKPVQKQEVTIADLVNAINGLDARQRKTDLRVSEIEASLFRAGARV